MFDAPKHKFLIKDFPLIKGNYTELITEDVPILFYGNNSYGNIILGSAVLENEEESFFRFIHVAVDNSIFGKFINQEISYRTILENSEFFFLVDKFYDDSIKEINLCTFYDLPEKYQPKPDSLLAPNVIGKGLDYEIVMKGGLSDFHQILPKDGNEVQQSFIDAIQGAFNTIKNLAFKPIVYQRPALTGSFKLNFHIQLNEQDSLFPIDSGAVTNYIGDYLSFVIKDLPKDKSKSLEISLNDSEKVKGLETQLSNIYTQTYVPIPVEIGSLLKENIKLSAERFKEMSEQIGESFSTIGVANLPSGLANDSPQLLGVISSEYKDILTEKLTDELLLEVAQNTFVEKLDSDDKEYNINIFHFNAKTGSGEANIFEGDNVYPVTVKVKTKQSLFGSVYTKSMHEQLRINVKARALKVGEKYKSLIIQD